MALPAHCREAAQPPAARHARAAPTPLPCFSLLSLALSFLHFQMPTCNERFPPQATSAATVLRCVSDKRWLVSRGKVVRTATWQILSSLIMKSTRRKRPKQITGRFEGSPSAMPLLRAAKRHSSACYTVLPWHPFLLVPSACGTFECIGSGGRKIQWQGMHRTSARCPPKHRAVARISCSALQGTPRASIVRRYKGRT